MLDMIKTIQNLKQLIKLQEILKRKLLKINIKKKFINLNLIKERLKILTEITLIYVLGAILSVDL
jgi:hypothetical protein